VASDFEFMTLSWSSYSYEPRRLFVRGGDD
jgi:hypothetical protein